MPRPPITVLSLLLLAIPAMAQQLPPHLEIPDQDREPPALAKPLERIEVLPWVLGAFSAVQVNVDSQGRNRVGDAANEPSIAVDPNNPDRMAVGWRQFNTQSSSFRTAGWAYSQDGGQTWTHPGAIQPSAFRSDPVLDVDAEGNFFYNSLGAGLSCDVFRSSDGGVTWGSSVPARGGDKQWMAIDRTGGTGDGHIYAVWNRAFSTCSGDFTRSTDGGLFFSPCVSTPSSPRLGTMDVGPDGTVYIAGATPFLVLVSTTLQNGVGGLTFDFTQAVNLGGSVQFSTGPNPGGLLGQAYVATDHSNGPTAGNVYFLASAAPSGPDPLDVRFARSEDGGQTWSESVRVNDDPLDANAWQWFAMMDVAPNGRIDVVWCDTRNHPGSFLSELFYAYSHDGGRTWSANAALTPAFDPHLGWPQQNKIGDYNDLVSLDDAVHVIFSATFNGEQDIYFLRIPDPKLALNVDVNGDGQVNGSDLNLAVGNWNRFGGPGDVDCNGLVDVGDTVAILNAFGSLR